MNGIEKITERIRSDAQREIQTIADESRAKCEEITAAYKEQAQSRYWKIVSEGKKDAERVVELRKSAAQTESKKRMLQLRQEMVAKAFDGAEKKLLALDDRQYADFLVSLAVQAAESGEESIVLSAADRAKYGEAVTAEANERLAAAGKKGGLKLSGKTADIEGGLILSDGKIETNCSIKTLMEIRRSELAPEVARLLFD